MSTLRFDTIEETKIRKRIASGETLRSIADDYGVSRQRIHAFLNRPNPKGRTVTYTCAKCCGSWKSQARYVPDRCGVCGTHHWKGARKAS